MGRIKDLDEIKAMVRERTGKRNIFRFALDDLTEPWSELSLKDQGWLDKPSCPMLIVNGKNDLQTPIADLYILLEHSTPKLARVFPGGQRAELATIRFFV